MSEISSNQIIKNSLKLTSTLRGNIQKKFKKLRKNSKNSMK